MSICFVWDVTRRRRPRTLREHEANCTGEVPRCESVVVHHEDARAFGLLFGGCDGIVCLACGGIFEGAKA